MKYYRAREMLSYLPEYYRSSCIYNAHNDAKAEELNIIRELLDEIQLQFVPQTATWGLDLWEELCNLHNEGESDTIRRQRVIAWLQIISPMTVPAMQRICEVITHTPITIIQDRYPYTFSIEYTPTKPVDMQSLYYVVEEAKPAHLALEGIQANYAVECPVYVRTGITSYMCYEVPAQLPPPRDYKTRAEVFGGFTALSTQSYDTKKVNKCPL